MGAEIDHYQTDYPALFRVLNAVNYLFIVITNEYKIQVRDKARWRNAISTLYENKKARINSVDELRANLVGHFVEVLEAVGLGQIEGPQIQQDIDDCRKILRMVSEAYTSKKDRELVSLSKKERKQNYTPYVRTYYSEDLLEAEAGLQFVLTEPKLLAYNDLARRFYERNPSLA